MQLCVHACMFVAKKKNVRLKQEDDEFKVSLGHWERNWLIQITLEEKLMSLL